MLRDGVEYHDLGDQYFAHRDKEQITKRLLQRLRDLGVNVEVQAARCRTNGLSEQFHSR
jgi:hypothetical protein